MPDEEIRLSMDDFCRLAGEVVEAFPPQFQAWMQNVVVDVRNRPTRRMLTELGLDPENDTLLGLFEGVPVTEQDPDDGFPNRVWLFKRSIEEICRSREEVAYEIRRTIIHELAHHFGWSEEDLEAFESQPNPFDDGDSDDAKST
ncbi:MAG: metallopeptidase family protein [Planctomycetales bacterium]|nr:metallopeptidase family protein [Planctomycetales bacterium]MBN8628336.1 metallopeptidase family protein [Planctomycetota bacterium]